MSDFKNMSNNEIVLSMKNMEQEHESIKSKILKLVDEMEEVEKKYAKAGKILNERLNPNKPSINS